MIQQQTYAAVPVSVNYRVNYVQPAPVPLQSWPTPINGTVPVPISYVPVAQRYPVMYRYPVVQAPMRAPVPIGIPLAVPMTIQRSVPPPVPQVTSSSGSSIEYDSGVALMDTSDPSLAVDVSLSLPSSPTSSTNSETSPLPTMEDLTYTDTLNTAFYDPDSQSVILHKEPEQRYSNT